MSLISIEGKLRHDDAGCVLSGAQRKAGHKAVPPGYFRRKAVMDRVLAVILLIPGLPLIGILVLLVRITSRGPGFYRQTRVGKGGQLFLMNKIRTMSLDAEVRTGPMWTQVDDPRITRLGRVLRKLHLDELPQLFNVLRGEMSLIGPRPERPEFVHVLAEAIPGYTDRLAVCPGITGLAQINLDPDTDLESVRRKLVLDLEYITTAGLFLDIRMLACTSLRLAGLEGHIAKQLTKMHRDVPRLRSGQPAADGNGSTSSNMLATPATPATLVLRSSKDSPGGQSASEANRSSRPRAKRRANGVVARLKGRLG